MQHGRGGTVACPGSPRGPSYAAGSGPGVRPAVVAVSATAEVRVQTLRVAAVCDRCGESLIAEMPLAQSWAEAHMDVRVAAMLVRIDNGLAKWLRVSRR